MNPREYMVHKPGCEIGKWWCPVCGIDWQTNHVWCPRCGTKGALTSTECDCGLDSALAAYDRMVEALRRLVLTCQIWEHGMHAWCCRVCGNEFTARHDDDCPVSLAQAAPTDVRGEEGK